jgi:hypothetical protein
MDVFKVMFLINKIKMRCNFISTIKIGSNHNMRKLVLTLLICLSFIAFSFGCGSSNPFIGEWKIDVDASRDNLKILYGENLPPTLNLKAAFSDDKLTVYLNDEVANETNIIYEKVDKTTWKTCLPDGTQCDTIDFLDKNTMNLPLGADVSVVMKRI